MPHIANNEETELPPALISYFTSAARRDEYLELYAAARRLSPDPDESCDVSTRYGTVRVYRHGSNDGIPILLIHGGMATSAGWAANVEGLAARRTVYTLDALGQGGASVQVAAIRSAADQVSWLMEVVESLRLSRVHIVGWSYGGWLAFQCARHAPERFATLTLIELANILARFSPAFWRCLAGLTVVSRLPGTYFTSRAHRYFLWMFTDPQDRIPQVLGEYRPLFTLLTASTRIYLPAGLVIPTYPSDGDLRSLQVPVQALLGGISTAHDSAKAARRLADLIPTAQIHRWPTAGHAPNLERADEVNRHILGFAAQHSSARRDAPDPAEQDGDRGTVS